MRIKNISFSRKSEMCDVLPKVYVMMEGTETEPLYFKELFHGIRDFEYLPFEKDALDLGWSNPLLLINQLKLELDSNTINLSYAEFLPFIIRYLRKKNQTIDVSLFKKEFNDKLAKKGIKNRNNIVSEEIIESILIDLKGTAFINLVYDGLEDFKNEFAHLREDEHPYNPDTDKLVLIVDRDKKSFSESQYDKVIENSEKYGVDLYVTNPCFEFFLALHFSDLKHISEQDLLENKISDDITYVHSILLSYDQSYEKDNYDVQKYISNLGNVINNIKKYENDICKIKNKVGSNLLGIIEKYKK